MMLTRPIFQLSIILSLPILIYFILKESFTNYFKFKLILILFLSYFLSMGVQFARYYYAYENFAYSTQSGKHLNKWIIPCLSQKFGCGSRNLEVLNYIDNIYKQKISEGNFDEVEKNKIAMDIGISYLKNEMENKKMLISIFFSYSKLLFHSSLVEIYPYLKLIFRIFYP